MARIPDGCLVQTAPLAEMLRTFFREWARDRPPTAGQFSSRSSAIAPVRASAWLAEEARVWNAETESYDRLSESTIQNILEERYRKTELRVADAIATALDRPEVFQDGTLEIEPNPSAPAWAREQCCGGSMQSVELSSQLAVEEILRVNLVAVCVSA